MRIAAFDMGIKNFAFAVVDLVPDNNQIGHVLSIDLHDLGSSHPHKNLIVYLKTNDKLWETVDVILIEQQLNRSNIQATKMSCHVFAYFLHRHPDKPILDYPSIYKTKYTNMKSSCSYKQRKDYAVHLVMDLYQDIDPVFIDWLSCYDKKDDICDCVLMCNTLPKTPLYKRAFIPKLISTMDNPDEI